MRKWLLTVTLSYAFVFCLLTSKAQSSQQMPQGFGATGTDLPFFVKGGTPVGNWNTDALSINGAVQIGQTAIACTPALAGAMRYNPSYGYFEGCNGILWAEIGATKTTQVYAQSYSCGNDGNPSVTYPPSIAYCPAGWRLTGGGYTIAIWNPDISATNKSNAPDASEPIVSENAWQVVPGGVVGFTCFYAYAVCIQ